MYVALGMLIACTLLMCCVPRPTPEMERAIWEKMSYEERLMVMDELFSN